MEGILECPEEGWGPPVSPLEEQWLGPGLSSPSSLQRVSGSFMCLAHAHFIMATALPGLLGVLPALAALRGNSFPKMPQPHRAVSGPSSRAGHVAQEDVYLTTN